MYNNLDLAYYDNAVDGLIKILGIAEPVDANILTKLAKKKKYNDCLQVIVDKYRLPINFNIKIVPRGYNDNLRYFKTSGLSRTDEDGKGVESITAQVSIPSYVPLFGDPKLKDLNVDIIIGEECGDYPETFIYVIAHEIAHLLLETLRHPEKNNEIYADIVPLLLGFIEIASIGRTVKKVTNDNFNNTSTITTTTYGYMNKDQFNYSVEKIKDLLDRYRFDFKNAQQHIFQVTQRTKTLERLLIDLNKYRVVIGCKSKKHINVNDAGRLVRIHDVGYMDAYERILMASRKMLQKHETLYANVTHYSHKLINQLNEFDDGLNILLTKLSKAINHAKQDLAILKRNLKFTYKLEQAFKPKAN
jgi:hypothetical protein